MNVIQIVIDRLPERLNRRSSTTSEPRSPIIRTQT